MSGTCVSNDKREMGDGEMIAPGDEGDEGRCDFARRRRIYNKEGRGVKSGVTGING